MPHAAVFFLAFTQKRYLALEKLEKDPLNRFLHPSILSFIFGRHKEANFRDLKSFSMTVMNILDSSSLHNGSICKKHACTFMQKPSRRQSKGNLGRLAKVEFGVEIHERGNRGLIGKEPSVKQIRVT